MPLNIDVQSYKKLHEKNLFNDLSSHGREDTYCQCQCDDTIRSEPSHFPVSWNEGWCFPSSVISAIEKRCIRPLIAVCNATTLPYLRHGGKTTNGGKDRLVGYGWGYGLGLGLGLRYVGSIGGFMAEETELYGGMCYGANNRWQTWKEVSMKSDIHRLFTVIANFCK